MKELKELVKEIEKCVRCGTCRSICPTFRVLGRETACARGKLTLIQAHLSGELPITDAYIKHLKECTLCGGCRDTCPNGVKTVEIINAARIEVIEKQGMPLAASLVFKNMLDSGKVMPMVMKLATRLQGLLFKGSVVEGGFVSRFSIHGMGNGRLLPQFATTFFMETPEAKALFADGKPDKKERRAARVAFYAGCGVNYLMPNVGIKSLEVLKRAGAEVVVPSGQICCGMPAFSMGDKSTAKGMALRNLEAFEGLDVDYITTSCATCGHALKNLFVDLLGDDAALKTRVEAFSAKVMDITALLADVLKFTGVKENGESADIKVVTYHDPCHLNRSQGVRSQPRELLKNSSGLKFREMRFPCSCCGLGGGLNVANYELSIEVARRKAESVRGSGADVVATACPGCMVQLRDAMHKYGVEAKVVHVVELL